MGTYVEATDLRGVLDPRDPTASTQIPDSFLDGLITRSEARLRAQVARLDDRVASGELDRELVRSVLIEAMTPAVRNPGGFTTESAGDRSYTYSAAAAAGSVSFSPADLDLLRPRDSAGTGGIGSATLALPRWQW